MKTVCGAEATDSKDMPSAGHRDRVLKVTKYGLDSLAQQVSSNSEHFRQSVIALSCFFQKVTIFFFLSWKDQAPLDLYFLELCPKHIG